MLGQMDSLARSLDEWRITNALDAKRRVSMTISCRVQQSLYPAERKAGHGNDRVWKEWKAKNRFPFFPHSLEIPSGFPHSHGLDD
jgi:hypothetical protein